MDIKAQSGNVLFIILIAVALFAALSYAVTKSQRVGENGAGKDKARIKATQILDYSAYLAQIYQRLVFRGVTPANVRYFAPGNNDICRTGAGCLFSPEGGGGVGHSIVAL